MVSHKLIVIILLPVWNSVWQDVNEPEQLSNGGQKVGGLLLLLVVGHALSEGLKISISIIILKIEFFYLEYLFPDARLDIGMVHQIN